MYLEDDSMQPHSHWKVPWIILKAVWFLKAIKSNTTQLYAGTWKAFLMLPEQNHPFFLLFPAVTLKKQKYNKISYPFLATQR